MDSEKVLPRDMRFETYLSDRSEAVLNEVDRARSKEFFSDLLDLDFEFESIDNTLMVYSLAKAVNEYVLPDGNRESHETMYRAGMFAYQVSKFVHDGEVIGFEAGRYLQHIIPREDAYEQLVEDVSLYLEDNQAVGEFFDYFSGEIDGGRGYGELADLMGGLMFMLIERFKAEQFIAE